MIVFSGTANQVRSSTNSKLQEIIPGCSF